MSKINCFLSLTTFLGISCSLGYTLTDEFMVTRGASKKNAIPNYPAPPAIARIIIDGKIEARPGTPPPTQKMIDDIKEWRLAGTHVRQSSSRVPKKFQGDSQSQLPAPASAPLPLYTIRSQKDDISEHVANGDVSAYRLISVSPPANEFPPHSVYVAVPSSGVNLSPDVPDVLMTCDDQKALKASDQLIIQKTAIPGVVSSNSDLETPSEKTRKILFNNRVFPEYTPTHQKKNFWCCYSGSTT